MKKENVDRAISATKEGWVIKDIAGEAGLNDEDQIQRQILRRDESEGDADKHDIGGAVDAAKRRMAGKKRKQSKKEWQNDNDRR